jgi:hypothetical protein
MKLIIDTTENTIEVEGKKTDSIYDIWGECDISICRKFVATKLNDETIEMPLPIGQLTLTINHIHAVERERKPKNNDLKQNEA